jgi:hypothetical protein
MIVSSMARGARWPGAAAADCDPRRATLRGAMMRVPVTLTVGPPHLLPGKNTWLKLTRAPRSLVALGLFCGVASRRADARRERDRVQPEEPASAHASRELRLGRLRSVSAHPPASLTANSAQAEAVSPSLARRAKADDFSDDCVEILPHKDSSRCRATCVRAGRDGRNSSSFGPDYSHARTLMRASALCVIVRASEISSWKVQHSSENATARPSRGGGAAFEFMQDVASRSATKPYLEASKPRSEWRSTTGSLTDIDLRRGPASRAALPWNCLRPARVTLGVA